MEVLSSTFLSKNHHLLGVSSIRINHVKRPRSIITSDSSFNIFETVKELITSTTQTLKNSPQSLKKVHKKNKQSLLQIIFKSLDDSICAFMDSPFRPSIDPKHVLSGNFAPVGELPPTACEVAEGFLPTSLDGAYIRNGPNPQFIPRGPYHLLDGDGMLHVVKISKGKVTYCSHFVKTYKYMLENKMGYPILPSPFASFNGVAASIARLIITFARIVTGKFNPLKHGLGTANTSVAQFGGKILALAEYDLPHGVVRPFLTFFRINSDGRKQKDVKIFSMDRFSAIHDFAVTKNYAIFPNTQIVLNPLWILRGRSPLGVDISKVPRFGIIPRSAEDEREMWWIDAPGLNMLHCVNSWEEEGGERIVIVASNIVSIEQVFENIDLSQLRLEKIVIDVKARTMERYPLSDKVLDLGVINPAYAMKKNRYVYAAVVGVKAVVGVVKLDLSLTTKEGGNFTVASRLYGPGCGGGEPVFVPREPSNPAAEEDDGYLLTFVYDENADESKFVVMDAKSPSLDIIAAVKLPRRVPTGFHGLFVSGSELEKL
ncbi:Beta, beta-carotene 15,15'-dioxygenase [Handroanthus impetiginosus]|uniref:Beta, beta-carotene 15,15'-dioxygenase n=1 Tax=Handroanthus impetiginosus TaxID=429701 RepID=A0A2G9GGD3_9LAMI|nr:Beta, beta-carotene 15,15'-dioxygenase [Handroanthus impetiginosus]